MQAIELTKEIALDLVMSKFPSFRNFGLEISEKCGRYYDQYGKWDWNIEELRKFSTKDLFDYYKILKKQYD